jgi:uncharacterized membrane protein HdeD (DUF308 family)
VFVWIAIGAPVIVAAAMVPAMFSERLRNWDVSLVMGIACAIYGVVAVSAGMISAIAVAKLTAKLAFGIEERA